MSTPLPPSAESPSGTTPSFPPPTARQMLRSLRAPALGYAWLLLGAVATMVLIVVATNVGSTDEETGVESDDTNAIGVLIGMPFQIAGMALLGSLRFTTDGAQASLFLPPLILTALFVGMTVRAAANSGEVVPAAGTRGVLAVVVGFAAAVVITPATWALAMRSDGAALHAASVGLFFGVWALTGIASYIGSTRAAGAARPAWIPSDYAIAARLWVGSLVLWITVAFVVLTVVAAIKEDLWLGIVSPLWGPTTALYTYALGHFGGISFGGENLLVGDFSAVWTVVMVVGALALAVLTSLAWHLRRDTRASSLAEPGSWAVLPASFAVGGMVVWLVPSVVLGGGLGDFGASVTLQPAFWLVFVLLVWGAAVEVASRFVAPSLSSALPARWHSVLRGPVPVEAPTGSVAAEPVPATPLTDEERARYKKIGIAAGGLLTFGVLGWVVLSVVNSQFYGPEDQATAYLDAVVAGDLDEVNDLAQTEEDEADDALLTSAIYRAAERRITGYEIGDIEKDGETVTVEVRLEGLGEDAETQITLAKDGRSAVLFDKWRVVGGGLAKAVSVTVPDGAGELTVNGVAVDRVDDDVWLLPGEYVIDAFSGNRWLTSVGEPVTVSAEDDYQFVDVPGAEASVVFRDEVQRQVDAYLATCMAATVLDPDNCPNSAYGFGDVRKVKWALVEPPAPDFDRFDGTFPADLSYGESGRAKVTYEADESYGFGPRDWRPQSDESDLYLSSVTVTLDGENLVVTIRD